MRIFWMMLPLALMAPLVKAENDGSVSPQIAAHNPLRVQCDAKPTTANQLSVTCKFTQNPKYGINVTPEPQVEFLAGNKSLLPSKIVPENAKKGHDPRYYGEMASVTATVKRQEGLQARVTYFFCSKADGFCARKIDKAEIRLP